MKNAEGLRFLPSLEVDRRRARFIAVRQLILDLLPETPPSLDNFVAGANEEALTALTGWLAGNDPTTGFCLYGEAGCGRSHLLQASGFALVDAAQDLERAPVPLVLRPPEALPMPLRSSHGCHHNSRAGRSRSARSHPDFVEREWP